MAPEAEHYLAIKRIMDVAQKRQDKKSETQREAQRKADDKRIQKWQERLLAGEARISEVEPTIIAILKELEDNVVEISTSRKHSVDVRKKRPNSYLSSTPFLDSVRLSWGNKVRMTAGEEEAIRRLQQSRTLIRFLRAPQEIVAFDARFIDVLILPNQISVRYGGLERSESLDYSDVLGEQRRFNTALAHGLMNPAHEVVVLERRNSYK